MHNVEVQKTDGTMSTEKELTQMKRKNQGTAFGLRGGYEYYSPNYIYAGIEGMYAVGDIEYTGFKGLKGKSDEAERVEQKSDADFINYEGRLGYTFEEDQMVVVPFLGLGATQIHPQDTHGPIFTTDLGYVTAGGKVKLAVGLNVDLGVNLKLLRSFIGSQTSAETKRGAHYWGYEAAVPLTWHTDDNRWNVQFEPYLFQLPAKADSRFLGTQLSLGRAF